MSGYFKDVSPLYFKDPLRYDVDMKEIEYDEKVDLTHLEFLCSEHYIVCDLSWDLGQEYPELVKLFQNILESLKHEVITDDEVRVFSDNVKQVLENTDFLNKFYELSKNDSTFICLLRSYGILTRRRENAHGKDNEKLMHLIRKDKAFGLVSSGEDCYSVVRGVLSILMSYTMSEDTLLDMTRRIHKFPDWLGEPFAQLFLATYRI